ncbi:MAG: type II toxin-antitoxin system RelE/ParE family toxin [Bryobacterales bacterium]|nr:type II toxin-antitoxin system RelE/ParE family toxin [Bryobacterales bacterium]
MPPIIWLGDSLSRLRTAPADIRSDAGYQLDLVQRGETPADFKPMPDIGAGVMEIRLHGDNEFRVFYVARFEEAVYVPHAFVKKTRATRKADIDIGKKRTPRCWKGEEDGHEIDQRNDDHKGRRQCLHRPRFLARRVP